MGIMKRVATLAVGIMIMTGACSGARADLLDDLSGKSLECLREDESYDPEYGNDNFFISKKNKLLWSTSELQASEGTSVDLRKPFLLKRSADVFVVKAKNMNDKPTTLTFKRKNKAVRLTRTDKDGADRVRPAEICEIKGGVENVIRQQNAAVYLFACGNDPSVACARELVRLCGENPSEKCRQKNQKKIDAFNAGQ